MNIPLDKIRGCLFGAAFGDALGARTEFVRTAQAIREMFPPDGPRSPAQNNWLITDDTQMMLAVGDALLSAGTQDARAVARALSEEFVRWYHDPENNRAPGNTCLRACDELNAGAPWQQATVMGSKGCGANMRVQPIGLLDPERVSLKQLGGLSQLQAAITHGHPTGLASAELTALAIRLLATGTPPAALLPELKRWAKAQRLSYHSEHLESFWERAQDPSPADFMARGWDECIAILDRVALAMSQPPEDDPCLATGEGWIAEEALATGLLCFLLSPDQPQEAIRRGAVTCGDSDSIACLAGAFAGAYHGARAWPLEWYAQIEHHERLERMATALVAL